MPIPTYRDVLARATAWRAENTPEALGQARDALVQGMKDYPAVLPLGDELVLVLKQLKDLDGAVELLRDLERRFKQAVGEETLCRWGSILKARANQKLASGGLGEAMNDFTESERYYGRAYEKFMGFYPRINQLTVRFVRASLAKKMGNEQQAAELLADVERDAVRMLADPEIWSKQPRSDDPIWSAASRAEACVLLRRWSDAEQAYGEAIRLASGRKFYHECMRDQILWVLKPAFERLSLTIQGPLSDPEKFFAL
jgi:tetratricopeptide (TPR) repeat protein